MDVHENVIHCCNSCDFESRSRRSLLRHVKSRHELKLTSCHLCTYKSVDRSSVLRHLKQVHQADPLVKVEAVYSTDVKTEDHKIVIAKCQENV